MKAGVLALQGDFREHAGMLSQCGATPVLVRAPEDLASVQSLCIPGGESTSMAKLALAYGLVQPIRRRALEGMPILGTCAGMILLAVGIRGGEPLLGLLDIDVDRNAYGRQVDSFEADLDVREVGRVRGVFIRAPKILRAGPAVEVLAVHAGTPAAVQQSNLLATSFHPEMAADPRLHERLLALAR